MGKKEKGKASAKGKDAKGKQAPEAAAPSKKERKAQQLKKAKSSTYQDDLTAQLATLGLRVKKITADGNCFFRALSDQLQGDESDHSSLRQRIVAFMVDHAQDFSPFVEDDQGFDKYAGRMRREGVWAGHMELQAASLLLEANICIHQAGQPLWAIRNHPDGCPLLHLSYHDGEHYNSVRMADDYGQGRPAAIVMGAANAAAQERSWGDKEEQMVMSNTGCDNPALVRKVLAEVAGGVDAAVERVISIMAEDEAGMEEGQQEEQQGEEQGEQQGEEQQQQQAQPETVQAATAGTDTSRPAAEDEGPPHGGDAACSSGGTDAAAGAADGTAPGAGGKTGDRKVQHVKAGKSVKVKSKAGADAAPSRNKACPCGSGQKYKNCCGAAAAAGARRKQAAGEAAAGSADLAAQQLQTLFI